MGQQTLILLPNLLFFEKFQPFVNMLDDSSSNNKSQ